VFELLEVRVRGYVEWLRLLVEALGALVIAAGVVLVMVSLARHLFIRTALNYFLSREIRDEVGVIESAGGAEKR
jgi:uncharacterized membrane protein